MSKARCKQLETEEEKMDAMHIQFIWEQFLLIKWLIKKKKKPSALSKLKEKEMYCSTNGG